MRVYIAHSLSLTDKVKPYVEFLESVGYEVYFPARDTPQDKSIDPKLILQANLNGIIESDEVHVIWDGKSKGTIFDLGNAYALGKPIRVIGVEYLPDVDLTIRSWYSYLYKTKGKYLGEYFEEEYSSTQ